MCRAAGAKFRSPATHRNGAFPLAKRDEICSFLAQKKFMLSGEPLRSEVAQSDDLGYTDARYELRGGGGASGAVVVAPEKGYYVCVWKRDRAGRRKIALDTTHPLPPVEK